MNADDGQEERRSAIRTTGGVKAAGPGQALAEALDRLVAACARADEETQALADGLLTRWRQSPEVALRLEGGALKTDEAVVLQGQAAQGAWILPACMAGLRGIRPHDNGQAEDLVALAHALAATVDEDGRALTPGIEALRDLLWCDGLCGLEAEVGPGWAERLDLLPEVDGQREAINASRDEAVRARTLTFAAGRGRDGGDRQELARLTAYAQRARSGALQLQPPIAAALRNACDNGVFWVHQTGELLRARPELEAGLSAGQLNHALVGYFEAGGDLRAVESVAALPGEPESVLRQAQQRMDPHALGRASGSSIPLDKRTLGQLSALFDHHVSPFSKGVARGLLERAANDEASADLMARFLAALSVNRMWPHADLTGASDAIARTTARLLKAVDAGPNCWADLVSWSSPEVAAWILRHAPPIVLSRVEANLKSLLRERTPQENAPLIQALAEQGSTSALRSLAEALLETRGQGWAGKVVPVICHALLKKRMAAQYLVPLFRDREVDPKMRLLVLRTLEAEPELLAEATRFYVGELVEPPEIKERLKAARKRLKRTGR